ncbi:MAG: hypothetical protein ABL925_21575 [Methylococcales bacterium]
MNIPKFTAENSLNNNSKYYSDFRGAYSVGDTSIIQPAAMSTCQRLGNASWEAYDAGDFNKLRYIEFLMTMVGCFD